MKKVIFFLSVFALCCTNLVSFAMTDTLNLGNVYFRTDRTWKIGNQEWSELVMASGCEKNDYQGESDLGYVADCRQDTNYGNGILFSWEAVNRYKNLLCPEPWRVPTRDDFINLDKALGGTGINRVKDEILRDKYLRDWGSIYGYMELKEGEIVQGAYYWSQSEGSAVSAHRFHFNSKGKIWPKGGSYKEYAHSIRCVR
jgi:uncharacterized protein (TIGR02145 family)